MLVHKIGERVFQLPATDWSRRLFDALIPLPDGTSYNSYLVLGSEKTALIDTADPTKTLDLLAALASVTTIDYVVTQHCEQDHSGSLPAVLARYPSATVVATPKAKPMLIDLLHLPAERIVSVEDGGLLTLGDYTLEFIHLPWAHWPETMGTYLREERLLFSCDLFGSHIATSELFVEDEGQVYEAAKRYYAEIMMPFARLIARNLERLEAYDIQMIAPSHGPAHKRPALILDAYRDWVNGAPKNLVVLPFISMHGSTQLMAERLAEALTVRGVEVQLFDLAVTDLGKLAMALVDAATIVLGAPTVLTGPHPTVANAAVLANALRPKAQFAAVIGSYLWGTKAVETLAGLLPNLKLELLEPVYIKGKARAEDFAALHRLADAIVEKHRSIGLLPEAQPARPAERPRASNLPAPSMRQPATTEQKMAAAPPAGLGEAGMTAASPAHTPPTEAPAKMDA